MTKDVNLERLLEVGIGGEGDSIHSKYNRKLERQLALEEEMHSGGIDRYNRDLNKAIEKNQQAGTKYGVKLLQGGIEKFSQFIENQCNTITVGQRATAISIMEPYKEEKDFFDIVSYITLRTILDGITMRNLANQIATKIASGVEDELRLREFERQAKPLFNKIMQQLEKKNSYRHKRRVLVHCMSKFDIQWTPWNTSKKAKLGVWLLICCETCTGLINTVNRKLGKNQTPKYVEATKATLDWIEKVNSKEEILSPLYWPTIIQPRKWKGVYNGGYWNTVIKQLPLIKTRNTNLLEEYNNRTDEMASMYQAVNHIQDTPWRINKNLYNLLKEIKEKGLSIGKLPPMEPLEEPISPVPDKDATEWLANPENKERFIHFKREKDRIKTYNVRTQSKRIAVSKVLYLANKFLEEPEIYFPHQLDFRGRAYPISMFLNPQGVEYARALLEFSDGKRMGDSPNSGKWLAIHTANVYGMDKLSITEREQWTKDNSDIICEVAKDPWSSVSFWEAADKPMLFMAAAFEWASYMEKGDNHITHLPVSVDGTCNGLQIFSLLLRDEVGGYATNLIPSDEPQDIYNIVAEKTKEVLEKETSNEPLHKKKFPMPLKDVAKKWLEIGINRKITKRPVMVVPYSGTLYACRQYVEDYLTELEDDNKHQPFGSDKFHPSQYLAKIIWEQINTTVIKAREAMDWLQHMSRLAASENIPVVWRTPIGFEVQQKYQKPKNTRVETNIGGKITKLSFAEETHVLNRRRQATGVAPNYIHSMDSASMMLTVNKCYSKGIKDFCMIHDSYGTHATNVEDLSISLREVFVEIFEENWLEKFRDDICQLLSEKNKKKVKPIPEFGKLQINEILKSKYFFA